eukprot:38107-Eustigmatos_ZCMA.PRE.1
MTKYARHPQANRRRTLSAVRIGLGSLLWSGSGPSEERGLVILMEPVGTQPRNQDQARIRHNKC